MRNYNLPIVKVKKIEKVDEILPESPGESNDKPEGNHITLIFDDAIKTKDSIG